jgi:hypothetical protein
LAEIQTSVPASRTTEYFSSIKPIGFVAFTESITAHSKDHMKAMNTFFDQNAEFCNVKVYNTYNPLSTVLKGLNILQNDKRRPNIHLKPIL